MSKWDIYWITRLDHLGEMLGICYVIIIISIVVVAITLFIQVNNADYSLLAPRTWAILKYLLILFFINSLGYLLPTTKEMAAIIILPKLSQNETLQQLPDNILNLANEWIKELSPKKGEEK